MEYRINMREVKDVKEPDWIIHLVSDYGNSVKDFKDYMADSHTHGLERYCGRELQIVLNLYPELVMYVLNSIGKFIVKGYEFLDGDMIYGLFEDENLAVRLEERTDKDGKPIFRVWMPDENGAVDETAEGLYGRQGEEPYIADILDISPI